MATNITQLDVVNACLRSMGETPLNSIDLDHPYVASALGILSEMNVLEQELGWWFNTDYTVLHPDPDTGFVYIPADSLNCRMSPDNSQYVERGNRMWDTLNSTYDIGIDLPVCIYRNIDFDNLSIGAKLMISLRTQLSFQDAFDGDSDKYQKIYQQYQQAYGRLRRLHIKNQNLNMMNTPYSAAAMGMVRPVSRYAGANAVMYPVRVR
ncbi:tail tubular protein A [Ralstonia phage BHDT_So9]|uniref:Tail tubular protein A n=1 Tax=Ralstonia phage BHDT_So9 TaxID=2972464 RepID=A0A9E7QWS7_9CAUD|nr:tail tubular protein A [Ralstonia phage BHDT_So9]UWI83514.1 tail tubular protein A [Ralstonia phage DLDT_So2]UZT26902.1 tail tubular protein A [Ralstonia phage BHDTSo81]WEM03430.1 non-contractile tail tubular protein [Ralstonia phage BHDT8]